MLVLGIETSCDETAAAVVRDGREIVSSVIASQIKTHEKFGGVVPELASREHLDKIVPIVEEAFAGASIRRDQIDGIAVTIGPGLIGSLLVGVSYAKAMSFALKKPLVGVNHIEGHIYSVCFENPPVEHPALALVVSGGHTNLFFVPSAGKPHASLRPYQPPSAGSTTSHPPERAGRRTKPEASRRRTFRSVTRSTRGTSRRPGSCRPPRFDLPPFPSAARSARWARCGARPSPDDAQW